MNATYVHIFIKKYGNGSFKNVCLSVFIDKSNGHHEVILQFFIMDGSLLCMNLKSNVVHIFYGWSSSHCTDEPNMFLKDKYYLHSNDDTDIFYHGNFSKLLSFHNN